MASSKYYSFLNFLFCCILLQQSILNCNVSSEGCGPTFKADKKITVELFYGYNNGQTVFENLCVILKASNGLISVKTRMGADISVDSHGKVVCSSEEQCNKNRTYACFAKYYPDAINDCDLKRGQLNERMDKRIKDGLADDILIANKKAYDDYKATVIPALVVNGKFYSCFTDYSAPSVKLFFCNAYNNGLKGCSQ